jgi:hypothetical protein
MVLIQIIGFLIALIILALAIIWVIKAGLRLAGLKEVIEKTVVLTDAGIEYYGFPFIRKLKLNYSEIASVELLSSHLAAIKKTICNYSLSVATRPSRLHGEVVAVKLKNPRPFEYLLFTPPNAKGFVEELQQRISGEGKFTEPRQ